MTVLCFSIRFAFREQRVSIDCAQVLLRLPQQSALIVQVVGFDGLIFTIDYLQDSVILNLYRMLYYCIATGLFTTVYLQDSLLVKLYTILDH